MNSKVVPQATLVVADVTVVLVDVAAVLVDVPVVLMDVMEVLNGAADVAVGEVLDELLGILPTVTLVLVKVLLVFVLLNFIADEAAGVLEHAGMADGGNGEGGESREHVNIGLHGRYSVGAEENSSCPTDHARLSRAS
jgi:hypothetical protein